jgi:hypothetical protein
VSFRGDFFSCDCGTLVARLKPVIARTTAPAFRHRAAAFMRPDSSFVIKASATLSSTSSSSYFTSNVPSPCAATTTASNCWQPP